TAAQTGITCLPQPAGLPTCITPNLSGFVAGNTSLVLQGTSMAEPHAAGMMALLVERYPDRSSEEMKAIAMNTALHDVYQFAGNANRIGVDRAGAGRIDIKKAVEATVAAFNADEAGAVNLAFFGEVVGTQTQTKRLRLVNYGTSAQTFSLGVDTAVDAPGISFSFPGGSSVSVPAGGSVFVDVRVSATASQMRHTRDVSADAVQAAPGAAAGLGSLPRHYITNESGYVTFSQGVNTVLRVPVYAALRPASDMTASATIATGGAPTGSTTIPLAGTAVCTGTLAAGPTCTGTLPVDDVSLVSAFELHAVGPKKTSVPGYANLRHVGVAYDPTSQLYLFAVSTWGDWGSPTDVSFNISVDNNEDGTYDRVIFNTNPGTLSTILNSTATAQDSFITAVFAPATGGFSFGGAGAFVNRFSAATANSALFGNNVMFLAATAAQLGLAAGDTNFRYKVESCFGFNPLCTTKLDSLPGSFFWNSAAQGLDFGGAHARFDLNGATIPVTWNTANMTANGSLGALLLHHHNTSGNRAQVVTLEGVAKSDLALTQSLNPTAPTKGATVTISLTVTNNGPDAATGVSVASLLPTGLTHQSNTGAGAYDPATGVWTIGNLANGANATLDIVALVADSGKFVVESTVSSTTLDSVTSNNAKKNEVTAGAQSTMAVSVTPTTAGPYAPGQSVSYDIAVTNSGADTLFNVAIAVTGAQTSGIAAVPVNFSIASIAGGATVTRTASATIPDMAGKYTVTAVVSAENAASVIRSDATISVLSQANVTATKTVTGPFAIGNVVTYQIVLSNSLATSQQDNAGDELVDVLPSTLTLISANASSGTANANIATNTVRWNGNIVGNSSVTVTVQARINAGTEGATITSQATANFDADGNGVNEAVALSDDPGVAGASNPTSFLVPFAVAGFTKTLTAPSRNLNDVVTYTLVITNTANTALADNAGDEMIDVLPAGLTLIEASATGGVATANVASNTVTWNGSIAPSGSVTVTIRARINAAGAGQNVVNQARLNFDADLNGSNESVLVSDDPAVAGNANATAFDAAAFAVPVASPWLSAALILLLLAAAGTLRRRRD
ncbi:MAG: hypothetical protein ACRDAM_04565, partial [Casimicrobium sp.]